MSHKPASRRLKLFGWIVFLFFFIVAAILAGLSWKMWKDREKGEIPSLFGYQIIAVEDSSMEPQLTKGSGLLVSPLAPDNWQSFQIQDVVAFCPEGESPVAKRVIDVVSDGGKSLYCLKGDAEKSAIWVPTQEIVGTVRCSLPFVGNLLQLTRTREGLIVLFVVPCGIFLGLELILLIAAMIAGKREKRRLANIPPLPDDRDEHFIDVTAQYMGRSGVKLQGFLSQKKKQGPFAQLEEAEDKFAGLDYNPLRDRDSVLDDSPQPVERVIINTREADLPMRQNSGKLGKLTLLIDGAEAAELPLSPTPDFTLKAGNYTVRLSIAPDDRS